MQTETTTGLIKVEEVSSIMATAPDVLTKNQNLLAKAKSNAQPLIDTAASGMSDELDQKMNDWQVRGKEALKILNERRSPITQMMTQISKVFTGMENDLKETNERIQKFRDGFAAEKIRQQRLKEAEIKKQQDNANERITIKAKIEENLRFTFQDFLLKAKTYVNQRFEALTLENFAEGEKWLKEFSVVFKIDKWQEFKPVVNAIYLTQAEVENVVLNVKTALYDELAATFRENMEVLKQETLDKLPSKKTELETIAKAGEEEKQRLEAERAKRIEEENKRLEDEAAKAKAQAAEQISATKEVEAVNTLFDAQAQMAEVAGGTNAKEGYNIEVKNYAGWMQLASFWFEHEGKTLAADKFEKKTLGQMKAFAEKAALKNEKEKIESAHLVYHEVFKAVTTKA